MNKQRRKELEEAVRLLEEAYSTIESILEQEQEAFDNMPEGLQESERGEQSYRCGPWLCLWQGQIPVGRVHQQGAHAVVYLAVTP